MEETGSLKHNLEILNQRFHFNKTYFIPIHTASAHLIFNPVLPEAEELPQHKQQQKVVCHLAKSSVTVEKPKPLDYPTVLNTIGDHIKKRRFDLRLTHKKLAKIIGIFPSTLINWEKNHSDIEVRFIPKVIEFLGYNPLPIPKSFIEKLAYYRKTNGLSAERLAIQLGLSHSTISSWESGVNKPTLKLINYIKQQIDLDFKY